VLFRAVLGFFQLFPYQTSKAMLIRLFDLVGYRLGIRRSLAEKQLKEIFPDKSPAELQAIIRNVYRHMAVNAAESYLISDEQLFAQTTFEHVDYAEEALALKKGVLLITGHFGNWESPFRMLPMEGWGVAAITKKQRNTLFDAYTNTIRERQNGTIIDMKNALRGVLEHCRHNDFIGILIDQDAGKRGVLADFLGKPCSNWTGTAKIALRYQIPIQPGFVVRNPDDTLTFQFDRMLDLTGLKDTPEDILTVITLMNEALERKIRQYPDQWFWLHNRWKGARHFAAPE